MKRVAFILAVFAALAVVVASADAAGIGSSQAPRIKIKAGTSSNWSGYAVQTNLTNPQNGAVTYVTGSWTVPAVTCTGSAAYSSVWAGIDGYSDNTVEQLGTDQDCTSSGPRYYAWYEMYPKFPTNLNYVVKPGDVISAEVSYVGSNKFILTMSDPAQGWKFSTTQRSRAQRSSAEWIVEAPWSGGVLPLADFGTANISHATATLNNHTGPIDDNAWQYDRIVMDNPNGQTATPSNLSGTRSGSNFSVTWSSSSGQPKKK